MAKLRAWHEGRYEKLPGAVYKRRGWTGDGVPTLETLQRLRIDFPWLVEVVRPLLGSLHPDPAAASAKVVSRTVEDVLDSEVKRGFVCPALDLEPAF